jgi:hypothetical protein
MPDPARHLQFLRDPASAFNFERRLTADLNSPHSPAMARYDAMRNQTAIAAPFRIIAAEAGWVAAERETAHAPDG